MAFPYNYCSCRILSSSIVTSPLTLCIAAYASLLPGPGQLQTPYHWSENELSALHYNALKDNVLKQRKTWGELWGNLERRNRAGREITKDDLVWAMESVLSRAFKGSFGSGE